MRDAISTGQHMAALLAGSWRVTPPPLDLPTEALPEILPLLQETGAGSLAYRRLSRSNFSQPARQLRQTYRLHSIEAAVSQKQLRSIVKQLTAAGVEPLIVKGWSISRLYPEPGLRPYGDIDVSVRPEDMKTATEVLTKAADARAVVDLHAGVADLEDRRLDDLYRRSRLVALGDTQVRILGAEDQLRHQCLHLMRHGAWRALWLCDVGAAIESLPANFNWDYCLSGDTRLTEWVMCAVALACRLLDGQVVGTAPAFDLPDWMPSAICRLWRRGAEGNDAVVQPISACMGSWDRLTSALRRRWPNPIRAAFKLGLSPYSRLPRALTQTAAFSVRAYQYVRSHAAHQGPEPNRLPFEVHPAQVR